MQKSNKMSKRSFEIKIQDNTKDILKLLKTANKRGLKAIGLTAEGHAKEIITDAGAVDTGRLRNSITFALSGEKADTEEYQGDHGEEGGKYEGTAPDDENLSLYLGTNVVYAEGIETGTHRNAGAVEFIKGALTNAEYVEEYKQLLKDELENS